MTYQKTFYTLALVVTLAAVIFAVATVSAQTTAVGPYYAWPSWDQQLPASTRFIVLSNWKDTNFPSGGAAVLDRETGLVWERSPDTNARTWLGSQVFCNIRSVGGRKGWRMPTLQELATLVDPSVPPPGPALPAGHPFTMASSPDLHFSATNSGANIGNVWGLRFSDGTMFTILDKNSGFGFVWCVRGGQGMDTQ